MTGGVQQRVFITACMLVVLGIAMSCGLSSPRVPAFSPSVTCLDPAAIDQDDMCLWVHPADPSLSVVITADKKANKLFVYDLQGKTLQAIDVPKPGNIDVRYGFPLAGGFVDIVASNQRDRDHKITLYAVQPESRRIERIDNDAIVTGKNYGGALYHSEKTGKVYFIATSQAGTVEQYELSDDGTGRVQGHKIRELHIGPCEGVVADDDAGLLYIAEEKKGIWEFGAEPGEPAVGKLIAAVGTDGLRDDVEGLALYRARGGSGYLLVSSQGDSTFKVYRRGGTHAFMGAFVVDRAGETDGIDVCSANLGGPFARGVFLCHSGADKKKCPVYLVAWDAIAGGLHLQIDTASKPGTVFQRAP